MLVRQVVGELQLVEGDHLLHPLLSCRRAVRVDVHPLRHLGIGLPCHDPSTVVELVAEVVGRDDVEEEDVLRLRVQPRHAELHLREHLPAQEHCVRNILGIIEEICKLFNGHL